VADSSDSGHVDPPHWLFIDATLLRVVLWLQYYLLATEAQRARRLVFGLA